MKERKVKSAFTIIENLILILLITLVISVIFFTKKILQESSVKSLIAQITNYNIALDSFTKKYHALPGDIQNTQGYGLTKDNTDGNGDNVITDRLQKKLQANGEISKFWMHLSASKMIDENYNGAEDEDAKIGETFPTSKIGDKIGIITFGSEGKTFYQIGFFNSDSDRIYMSNQSLSGKEAFLFDTKIDDGKPHKGLVMAAGGGMLNIIKNDECVKFSNYDRSSRTPSCQIRIEAK